jgi:hypothetical protein
MSAIFEPASTGAKVDGDGRREPSPELGLDPERIKTIMSSCALVDSIRRRVLDDIQDKDQLQLSNATYERVVDKLHQHGEVRALVAEQFSGRVKSAATVATIVVAVVGFMGFKSIGWMMEAVAQKRAEEAVSSKLTAFETRTRELESSVDKALQGGLDRQDKHTANILDEIRQTERSLDGKLQSASQLLDERRREFQASLDRAAKRFDEQVREAESAMGVKLDKRGQAATDTAKQAIDLAKWEAMKEIRDALSKGLREQSVSTGSGGGDAHDDDAQLKATIRAVELIERREVDGLVAEAAKMARVGAFAPAGAVLDAITNHPSRFPRPQFMDAAKIVTDTKVDALERYQLATELAISAVRAGDEDVYKLAMKSLEENALSRANPSKLPELAKRVHDGAPPERIREAIDDIDLTDLTARGIANVLALAKIGKMPDERVKDLESRLILKLEDKGASEYFNAVFLVEVLTKAPVHDRERVADALQKISDAVLAGDQKADPWKLAGMIQSATADLKKP